MGEEEQISSSKCLCVVCVPCFLISTNFGQNSFFDDVSEDALSRDHAVLVKDLMDDRRHRSSETTRPPQRGTIQEFMDCVTLKRLQKVRQLRKLHLWVLLETQGDK